MILTHKQAKEIGKFLMALPEDHGVHLFDRQEFVWVSELTKKCDIGREQKVYEDGTVVDTTEKDKDE